MTESQKQEFFADIYQLVTDRFVQGRDDHISFRQYRAAVCDHPSLMQIIGTVLPDTEVISFTHHSYYTHHCESATACNSN